MFLSLLRTKEETKLILNRKQILDDFICQQVDVYIIDWRDESCWKTVSERIRPFHSDATYLNGKETGGKNENEISMSAARLSVGSFSEGLTVFKENFGGEQYFKGHHHLMSKAIFQISMPTQDGLAHFVWWNTLTSDRVVIEFHIACNGIDYISSGRKKKLDKKEALRVF